ncbi:MAG: MBL fold metallo-hydrolase [Hyphomonadaceae bacterium]|nr:MBL fold metallo-hydrolase [Hyphomonadaceae bacterium]
MDTQPSSRVFQTTGSVWFRDFEFGLTSVLVRKTGARVPYSSGLIADLFAWFRYFFAIRAMPAQGAPFTIASMPERARPWYMLWAVARLAGGRWIKDASAADIVVHFEDATYSPTPPPRQLKPGARLINFGARDISKSRIAAAFEQAFGYSLAIDPRTYVGPAVEKSELNAAHDGRIIQCPAEPQPGRTYQRLVDNRGPVPNFVDDLRTPTVGGKPILVFIKRRPIDKRFQNTNSECLLRRVEDIFSADEIAKIGDFCARLGLDWGGLDILRDRNDGRIYIVDANKTDMGPPIALPHADKLVATPLAARAFQQYLNPPEPRMAAKIEFVRDIEFEYGKPQQVSPLIRRVIAKNPGPFTYTGTGVYIIGQGDVAVIDPGPDQPGHLDVLLEALKGERVTHIFVTHCHMDHSPAAHPLAAATGAKTYASGKPVIRTEDDVRLEAGDDLGFRPHVTVQDGERFTGPGWTIEAVATPGHTSNHMAYALVEENALFPGDHIMGWSTTVISPPDGDMDDYLASLEKVRDRDYATLWPTHGPPVRNVRPFIQSYIDHRIARENEIVAQLAQGQTRIKQMVPIIYAAVDPKLHPAACHSVLAHMARLVKRGRVRTEGAPGLENDYRLVR